MKKSKFVIVTYLCLILLTISNYNAFTEEITFSFSKYKGRGITEVTEILDSKLIENKNGKLNKYRLRYHNRGNIKPTAVVVHLSKSSSLTETLRKMEQIEFAVHIAVDSDGKAYQLMDSLIDRGKATVNMDDVSIHILAIGKNESSIINNQKQMKKLSEIVKLICNKYKIPINNYDIAERNGVFSHYQCKFKFGGFIPLDKAINQEGAKLLRDIIWNIHGKRKNYYPEGSWKDRDKNDWVFTYRTPKSTIKTKKSNAGKGLTKTPKAELKSVEQDKNGYIIESKRIKYEYKKDIEIKGVVLHYTLASNIASTLDWFNHVTSCSHIIVDKKGKAYQILDKLTHRAAAAHGTNDECIQIEIVGLGEDDLLENEQQKKKVMEVVKEIAEKYNIPTNNFDITKKAGIFSHGQAKKKWGHSQLMYGIDFDPGERYMKEIIEGIGGTYYYDGIEHKDHNYIKSFVYEMITHNDLMNILTLVAKEENLIINYNWKDRFNHDEWVIYPFSWTP